MTGTYFIKAVDKLGNESLDSTSSVAIIQEIKDLNAVATSTQHPTFSGTKTNTVVVGNELRLGTSILFDSGAGNFDTTGGLFDGGGGTVASSGTYDFDTHIDVGGVYTNRVTANVTMKELIMVFNLMMLLVILMIEKVYLMVMQMNLAILIVSYK